MKLALTSQVVSQEKNSENGRRMDDGRTPEHVYTVSSPCESDGSDELKKIIRILAPGSGSRLATPKLKLSTLSNAVLLLLFLICINLCRFLSVVCIYFRIYQSKLALKSSCSGALFMAMQNSAANNCHFSTSCFS